MTFAIQTGDQAKSLAKELFLEHCPGNEAWFDIAWEVVSERSQSKVVSESLNFLPGVGIGADADPMTRSLGQAFALIAEAVLEELPTSGQAMLDRLERKRPGSAKEAQMIERLRGSLRKKINAMPDYVVWRGEAEDAMRTPKAEYVSRADLAERFLTQRGKVDIFIYNGEVVTREHCPHPEKLEDRHVRLLTCLLIYRGLALNSVSLYKTAWRKAALPQGYSEKNLGAINSAFLSPAISDLREVVTIPGKSRMGGYLCDCRMSFLVIISRDQELEFAAVKVQ